MNPTATHPQWLFIAAAKGLQGYVLRSDPLKEMIGASELIEALPRAKDTGFLVKVLGQMQPDLGRHTVLTDASGAARILFDREEDARRLARICPLLTSQFAPGLEMAVALVEVKPDELGAAIVQAEHEINTHRNQPAAALPEAGPWVARNRRTGLPAAQCVPALKDEQRKTGKQDVVDDESARKRQAARWTSGHTLLSKVVPEEYQNAADDLRNLIPKHDKDWPRIKRWPLDLTQIATSDNSYLAVIHADANGLGTAMMACTKQLQQSKQAAQTYTALCDAIEAASLAAARAAMRRVIKTTLQEEEKANQSQPGRHGDPWPIPVRPIVCAGEDFTVVIRARHAIQFVADYLAALEQETEARFKLISEKGDLREPIPGLEPLTACAGVVFCKSHFPFSRAYALAERLCGFAKKQTERKASALAFLRLKSSLLPSDDCEVVVQHAFHAGSGPDRVALTMNPYLCGGRSLDGLPKLSDLLSLVKALDSKEDGKELPRSGLRSLVSRAYEGKTAADQAFERLSQVVKERDPAAWEKLGAALKQLTGGGLWKSVPDDREGRPKSITPLYDALELRHLGCKPTETTP
jgi:hypothetical protein